MITSNLFDLFDSRSLKFCVTIVTLDYFNFDPRKNNLGSNILSRHQKYSLLKQTFPRRIRSF